MSGSYGSDVEDDYFSDDDADVFEAPPIQHQESTFEVLDPGQCEELAERLIVETVELLCCERRDAEILLRQFQWDRSRLADAYMSDPEAVAAKAGVALSGGRDLSVLHEPAGGTVVVGGTRQSAASLPPTSCAICYDDGINYSALRCGHQFCNTCYTSFIEHKIDDEGHGERVLASTPPRAPASHHPRPGLQNASFPAERAQSASLLAARTPSAP